ncbi:hypothetical protein KJ780_01605 [Candidatus Micrarchaeota archaeon]|nr:hypothetical protein [Candidatus Micrarchaeota archaeon]
MTKKFVDSETQEKVGASMEVFKKMVLKDNLVFTGNAGNLRAGVGQERKEFLGLLAKRYVELRKKDPEVPKEGILLKAIGQTTAEKGFAHITPGTVQLQDAKTLFGAKHKVADLVKTLP